jgi:manganese/zinc/iron transport system substrate-binding protein
MLCTKPQLAPILIAGWLGCIGMVPLSRAADHPARVVTTTTMITDLAKQVGGNRVVVQGLMGPGVDPHLYKASQSDVARLRGADVVFYNGLLLEGKVEDVLTSIARTKKHVYAVTAAIPKAQLLGSGNGAGHPDPHVWFDVSLWTKCVDAIVAGLRTYDPSGAEYYETRGKEYSKRLLELHDWVRTKTSELPESKRVLITSHDAFSYFGKAYGFRVVAIQGISTVTEPSLADVVAMTEFIKKHAVKAVFVESSVPHKLLERVSEDAGVAIGGELFSDATGTPGELKGGYDVGTYEGMIRHNVNTIVNGLK